MKYFKNHDLTNIVTPVNVKNLHQLLIESNYDAEETEFLVSGFTKGFSLGYQGNKKVRMTAPNLKLSVGTPTELWNKVMTEVQKGRYAGPFNEIPFDHFIQSPIGLVPKDGGRKTRLIFHLSYPRNSKRNVPETSVNGNTPKRLTSVKYNDFDLAIKLCSKFGKRCKLGKSDMSSAFRHFGIRKEDWKYLVMKAKSPLDNKFYYFVDKCMPFGAAISCSHFQRFSNAVSHIVKHITKDDNVNYLDDFLFVAMFAKFCNLNIQTFLDVCTSINFPVALDKTFWATTVLTFLGLLIDTENQIISIPVEKINKASDTLNGILSRKSKKLKRKELERICGTFNFFGKCIVPGRAFTRRLYSYGSSLKPHHHIYINRELRQDLMVWKLFLEHPSIFARPFSHLVSKAVDVNFYTDASRNPALGCGGICDGAWFYTKWDSKFIRQKRPSIAYLELYAVTVGIVNWIEKFSNKHVAIFCDNQSVIHMVNNTTSKCKNCMTLIRIIVLKAMTHNVQITVKYVKSADNVLSDHLSRLRLKAFHRLTFGKVNAKADRIPRDLWPMKKLWEN